MESLKIILIFICTLSILIIVMPLIALALKNSKFQPLNSENYPITEALQNSPGLILAHICCLASFISVAMDIFMDFCAQNSKIAVAIRLKERVIIFFGLVAIAVVYLSCRSFDSIADIYVAANHSKNITMAAAIYFAIFPELRNKADNFLHNSILTIFSGWSLASVLLTYSLYWDSAAISIAGGIIQGLCYLYAIYCTRRWIQLVRERQRSDRFDVNQLDLEEFTFLLYWAPLLVFVPMPLLWNLFTGDFWWKTHSAENLIFLMISNFVLGSITIVVPGRIVRMMAEMHLRVLNDLSESVYSVPPENGEIP